MLCNVVLGLYVVIEAVQGMRNSQLHFSQTQRLRLSLAVCCLPPASAPLWRSRLRLAGISTTGSRYLIKCTSFPTLLESIW
ncbi:hypothetical protein BC628DRAFT_1364819 [Trametes gibbosa]|nr:hypothetical protein BC628DRAFT_1386611 [Trametes gibbosa]KAI0828231.1 hypothetical protein BC628DRAFT_1364819 [Trametes gibbosa]